MVVVLVVFVAGEVVLVVLVVFVAGKVVLVVLLWATRLGTIRSFPGGGADKPVHESQDRNNMGKTGDQCTLEFLEALSPVARKGADAHAEQPGLHLRDELLTVVSARAA